MTIVNVDKSVTDVLLTLAQLPNDEVFTPPHLANQMLDLLPPEVWSNHTLRWLDPAAKSGVFLREISARLMVGLANWEPDPKLRRQHILANMLFGAATSQLAGDLSRRSVYHTTDATGRRVQDDAIRPYVVSLSTPEGNIKFIPTNHTIIKRRCLICRAPEKLIRDRRENFAYSYIHGTYPPEGMAQLKFDVIVGNPPYQISMKDADGTKTSNVMPLYHFFVERAIEMSPRYVLMITPSRWFAGGKSLDKFRARMLADRRLKTIVDYVDEHEVFPSVDVEGGISYFLWDRDYSGNCKFTSMQGGIAQSTVMRDLRTGDGVLIRDNFAAEIVAKVTSDPVMTGSVAESFSARDPFGPAITTNYKLAKPEPFEGSIPLIYVNKVGHISPSQLQRNHEWVHDWKVLLPKAYGNSGSTEGRQVIGEPIAIAPGSACTQSYFVAGRFSSMDETKNFAQYLCTKFVRFLVAQRKISQDITQDRFVFVPALDMTRPWTDEMLFAKFKLSTTEVDYIEKAIGKRDWIDSLDSPIPATHLPGGRKYKAGDAPVEDDEDGES